MAARTGPSWRLGSCRSGHQVPCFWLANVGGLVSISSLSDPPHDFLLRVPAVHAAQSRGLTKAPRIRDLRHTHTSWLIQGGAITLLAISRQLGHASTRTRNRFTGTSCPKHFKMARMPPNGLSEDS
jgi:hypothetical protein